MPRDGRGGRGGRGFGELSGAPSETFLTPPMPGATAVRSSGGQMGPSPEVRHDTNVYALAGQRSDINDAYWTSTPNPVVWYAPAGTDQYGPTSYWAAPDPFTVFRRALWSTPLFDLRPDLKNRSAYQGNVQPVGKEILLGDEYALHVQVDGLDTNNMVSSAYFLTWYYFERGDVAQPSTNRYLNTRQEMTVDVQAGYAVNTPVVGAGVPGARSVVRFQPQGNIRYWQVIVVCDMIATSGTPTPPAFSVAGALH